MQTISDRNLRIIDIVARWAGGSHDQTIFINSAIHQRFERGDFGEYILIGDSGYANTRYLATPYTVTNANLAIDRATQDYNKSLIATRNVVERQYGLWKRRFPVLAYGLRLKKENCQKVIIACAVLHNLAIDANEPEPPEDNNAMLGGINEDNDVDNVVLIDPPAVGRRRRGLITARDRILQRFRERIRIDN